MDKTEASSRMMQQQLQRALTRRYFIGACTTGLGGLFLQTLAGNAIGATSGVDRFDFDRDSTSPLAPLPPQFQARARRVIYLHMAGGPSQLELFEHKPELTRYDGQDCPESFLAGKRFAFITGVPQLLGAQYPFHQAGQSGAWISDRLPHLEKQIDELCFIRSMRTEQFNHVPAQLFIQTGNARLGYASIGSWVAYGLGTENQNLPAFIVLRSGGSIAGGKQLWSAGFLPSMYQGVECRSEGAPIQHLDNPPGVSRPMRRQILDAIVDLNQKTYMRYQNPETETRIAQYEMAFRMQLEATDVMDISRESDTVQALYGAQPGEASFANNCLLARRLAERGVRFIQLYHGGWDSHGTNADLALNVGFAERCREVDKPIAALLADLKARGMLEDTLVVWGGEFGRTAMRENRGSQEMKFIGRDHHPSAFTMWMAGGGVKPGSSYGETDEMGYEIVRDPVDVRDLHATMLYLLGFDHHKLMYPFQGLEQKLTGVKPARVVAEILS